MKRWIFSGMRVEGTVLMLSIEKRARNDKMETRAWARSSSTHTTKEELAIFRKD